MKNKFEVRGDITIIYLDRRDGTTMETIVDTADLSKLMDFPGKWYAYKPTTSNDFYVHTSYGTRQGLHRYIMDAPTGFVVDHINHNPLDNRRENLRVVTQAENMQNKRINANNKTGYRGVRFVPEKNKFRAEVRLNRKVHHVGYFTRVEDAGKAASDARAKIMPFSQDRAERLRAA